MEKINIAELLKDCPQGMELDCALYENLEFDHIEEDIELFPIVCRVKTESGYNIHTFTKYGCYSTNNYAKCVIYPKGKTTWEGFVPPRKFKDGDILFIDCADKESDRDVYKYIFILKEIDSLCNYFSYCHLSICGFFSISHCLADNRYTPRFATEEEKQKLFDAIKANGYKWNEETKTLEKLVSDRFNINNLVPFESKVLVRDGKSYKWLPTIFGFYDIDNVMNYPYECFGNSFAQCIPYEGNEHLLGTTNDCDEFYKTW